MTVEDYLNSIRRNTNTNSRKIDKVSDTIKDLLNYEALKRAIADGVEEGSDVRFKRLEELSKKILYSSDASVSELGEIRSLLKLFYSQIPKNSAGNASIPSDSWIKALVDVLDKFGDSLPEKFRKRLKYDIVSSAAQAGADPKQVFQQLNMTQVNQTLVLQNIYSEMKDQKLLIERKAEAEKPVREQKERNTENFWKTKMGGVLDKLTSIAKGVVNAGKWLGLLYVAFGAYSQLSDKAKNAVKIVSSLPFLLNGTLFKIFSGVGKFASSSMGGLFSKMFPSLSKGFASAAKAIGQVGSKLKSIGTNFLWNTKAGNLVLDIATHPALKKISAAIAKIMPAFNRVFSKFLGPIGLIVSSVFDFIEGFAASTGSLHEKVLSGVKNVIHKLIQAFAMIPTLIIKGLFKAWDFVSAYFKKGLPAVGKDIFNGLSWMFKEVFSVLTLPLSTLLGEIIDRIRDKHPKIAGFLQSAKNLVDKTLPQSPIGRDIVSGSSGASITSPATGTAYMGNDAYSHLVPLANPTQTPADASGINKASGVVLSSQAADFIKRAGLTDTITSGTREAVNARDWTGGAVGVGKISSRSHASGNKFDIGAYGKNAQQLASTLEKLVKTPGLMEAHVEGAGEKWYNTYKTALGILAKKGVDTSKIGWWGSTYASAPHIDVLIDPKYSGVSAETQNYSVSNSAIKAADTGSGKNTNPLIAQMTKQLTTALNEQVRMLESGTKAPDQLVAAQNKANTTTLIKKLDSSKSSDSITFNKQNDITDAGLAALLLYDI